MNITADASGKSNSKSKLTSRKQLSGFTLIELMIVMVIVAIGVALAAPSFRAIIEKRRLTFAAENVAAVISLAQSEAVKRNQDVIVNMRHTDKTTWCIGATLGTTACDCRELNDANNLLCEIEDVPYRLDQTDVVSNPDYELMGEMNLNDDPPTSNASFTFDPIRGTLLDLDTVNIQMHTHTIEGSDESTRDYQLDVNILPTGRVSICTASGRKLLLNQYPSCSPST